MTTARVGEGTLPSRHGGRRPAIPDHADGSEKVVDAGLRWHDAASDGTVSAARPVGIARGYDTWVRVFGSVWFLYLAIGTGAALYERILHGNAVAIGWPQVISQSCILLFYLALWWLLLNRPPPLVRSGRITPTVLAFVGTYLPWTIALLPQVEISPELRLISASMVLLGGVLILPAVSRLGRSFSIVPNARRLVTSGPYAIVRHPLYLAEEIMVAGVMLQYLSALSLALLALHITIQVRRALYEEAVLRQAFPDEYQAYASMTARLVPFVW